MSGPRIILVILIALGALFAVGVIIGVGDGTKNTNPRDYSWVQALKEGFIAKERLRASDIRADCLNQSTFRIPLASTCRAEIREAEPRVRTLELRLIEGDSAQVKLEPKGENAVPIRLTLRNTSPKSASANLQIVKTAGEPNVVATLSLTCERASLPSSRCTVQLQ